MFKRLITRHRAGEIVPSGIYLNRKSWDLTIISEEEGCLPASTGDFYHLPVLLVMLLSPVIGLAFVLFLMVAVPIVVIYSIPRAIVGAVRRRRAARTGVRPSGHGWKPS